MFEIDWNAVFGVHVSLAEIVVRASLMYWLLFLLFRFVIRRDVGAVGVSDVLVVVLIADATQNGMAGEYRSVTEGAVLIGTLVGWNVLLDALAYRFPRVERLSRPAPLKLVENGAMLRHNMRREWITADELMTKLREHGVRRIEEVESACIESDGTITVRTRQGVQGGGDSDRSPAASVTM